MTAPIITAPIITVPSDITIAQNTILKPINTIAEQLGLLAKDIEPY